MCEPIEKSKAKNPVFEPRNFDNNGARSQVQIFKDKFYPDQALEQADMFAEPSDNRPVLHISFSGGRTSGYMTEYLIQKYQSTHRIIVTFANTGRELEETLKFVHDCDVHKGFNTVWLEAVIHPEKGMGTRHKVVTYETATRDGTVFSSLIAKYGIPNKAFRHCTRELKIKAMDSYLSSLGLERKMVQTAIGIRADEPTRSKNLMYTENYCFPLLDANETPMNKSQVIEWWAKQPFDLELEEHDGNCVMCFEKSDEKVMRQIVERPELFSFILDMESQHAQTNNRANYPDRVFFRGNMSGKDLYHAAKLEQQEPGAGKAFLKNRKKEESALRKSQVELAESLSIS